MQGLIGQDEAPLVVLIERTGYEAEETAFVQAIELVAQNGVAEREQGGAYLMRAPR